MLKKKDDNKVLEIEKLKFFSDQPLTADKEQDVRFDHLGIVNNLRKIVLNCPPPFTVGLFGKWGSGKTTILNMLKSKLQKGKIAVVNFDVWKHEGDALRRTFLKESVRQLKSNKYLRESFELRESLQNRIEKTVKGKFAWRRKGVITLLVFVILLIALGIFLHESYPQNLGIYFSIIFGGGLISGLFLWILQCTITSETLTTVFERFEDPGEFEEEFENIIGKVNSKRVVFVIDNLDRCTHSKAVELLSTIKTFMAKDTDTEKVNKSIFLIACDDEAIKKHIQGVYKMQSEENNEKPFNADEFLRKFFNTFLRIPDFIDTELQTYSEDLLRQTEVPQFIKSLEDVAFVITTAFRDNPRQIKQFINSLITHFFLARERESGEEPLITKKGTITDNVPFLAKFLIIRQQWYSEYRKIVEFHLAVKGIAEKTDKGDLKNFLRATKMITVPDIRPFIYLKQSEEERIIPKIRELELSLVENNQEMTQEILEVVKKNPDQVAGLKKVIPRLIDRNEGKRVPLLNIVSCSLDALRYHNLELNRDFYSKIADLLNDDTRLKSDLLKIDPILVFNEVLKRCNEDRNSIIAQYLHILGSRTGEKAEPEISNDIACILFKELIGHKNWLGKGEREDVKAALSNHYYSSLDVLSLFKDGSDQKDFISEETMSKFVNTFSNDDIENAKNINDKVNLLIDFKEIILAANTENIVKKLDGLLKDENSKPYREQKENLLNQVERILSTFHKQIIDIPTPNVLDTFADTITQGMNALGDITQKKIFVLPCFKLVNLLKEESKKSNINSLIQNFFTSADVDSVKSIFDKLNKKKKEELIKEFTEIFNQRVQQQQPIFDFLYPLAPEDIRTRWIINLINSTPARAAQKLKDLSYEIDDRKSVVGVLLTKIQGITFQEKAALYEAINKMKCANDAGLKNTLGSQIKSLLKDTDQNLQKVGYEALQGANHLSATVKREIVREVVEWLRSLEPTNAGQIYSVKSIILNGDILASLPSVQEEYIDFVFDKLLKRGINIDNVSLGIEILSKIKPKYEDCGVLFDDILARAETESNNQIKAELKSGLLKLKLPRKFIEKVGKL